MASPLRVCARCRHYRTRPAVEPFSVSELSAAGVLKAKTEWDQQQRQRAQIEQARFEANQPFDYEPYHFAWCAAYTRIDLVARAEAGDAAALDELATAGGATMDPVTGRIAPLYQLCGWLNPSARCERWQPRTEDQAGVPLGVPAADHGDGRG